MSDVDISKIIELDALIQDIKIGEEKKEQTPVAKTEVKAPIKEIVQEPKKEITPVVEKIETKAPVQETDSQPEEVIAEEETQVEEIIPVKKVKKTKAKKQQDTIIQRIPSYILRSKRKKEEPVEELSFDGEIKYDPEFEEREFVFEDFTYTSVRNFYDEVVPYIEEFLATEKGKRIFTEIGLSIDEPDNKRHAIDILFCYMKNIYRDNQGKEWISKHAFYSDADYLSIPKEFLDKTFSSSEKLGHYALKTKRVYRIQTGLEKEEIQVQEEAPVVVTEHVQEEQPQTANIYQEIYEKYRDNRLFVDNNVEYAYDKENGDATRDEEILSYQMIAVIWNAYMKKLFNKDTLDSLDWIELDKLITLIKQSMIENNRVDVNKFKSKLLNSGMDKTLVQLITSNKKIFQNFVDHIISYEIEEPAIKKVLTQNK